MFNKMTHISAGKALLLLCLSWGISVSSESVFSDTYSDSELGAHKTGTKEISYYVDGNDLSAPTTVTLGSKSNSNQPTYLDSMNGCINNCGDSFRSINCNDSLNRMGAIGLYVCELGAEILFSGFAVASGLTLISVGSSYEAKGEATDAHYETRRHYVCSYSNGKRSCKWVTDTTCVGNYQGCNDLEAAQFCFGFGGLLIVGVGAFWCYKFYTDYERFCGARN